jgi:hypothetical protein
MFFLRDLWVLNTELRKIGQGISGHHFSMSPISMQQVEVTGASVYHYHLFEDIPGLRPCVLRVNV